MLHLAVSKENGINWTVHMNLDVDIDAEQLRTHKYHQRLKPTPYPILIHIQEKG